MAPFEVYTQYLSLKSHFNNPKYDYFKYNKKVRATVASFNKRKDRYFFERTSRKYNDKEVVDFLVSNFVDTTNPQNLWIGQIINSGEKIYTDWLKRQQSLAYIFKEQSDELFSEMELESIFDCSNGHPPILKKFLSGKISIENLVIYNKIFEFSINFDKKLSDPVWEIVSLKISKYSPFLNIDTSQYKKFLRDIVREFA